MKKVIQLARREQQRERMRQLFIDATVNIIKEEGIKGVTIRKIANIAGYNSATLYNYFDELSHVMFFAAMKFLKKYTDDLPNYISRAQDSFDEFLLIWECFCRHSFEEPEIYHAIFGANLGDLPDDILNNYYNQFPEDIQNLPSELMPMLLEPNLSKRSIIALRRCIESGWVREENAVEINELILLVYHGMLSLFLNNRRSYTVEEATRKTVEYIRRIVLHSDELAGTSPSTL
jgi:AcrR family transcriptional regulator